MATGYTEDYEAAYAGQGFDTGEELIEWLVSMVTTYPNEYWPVWIEYDGAVLQVGMFLASTGRAVLAFAAHAYEADFTTIKEITLQTSVSRTMRGFPRRIPDEEAAVVFDGIDVDDEGEVDPLADAEVGS